MYVPCPDQCHFSQLHILMGWERDSKRFNEEIGLVSFAKEP